MKCSLALITATFSLAAATPIGGLPSLPVGPVLNEVGKTAGPALGQVDKQLDSTLDKVDKSPVGKPIAAPAVPAPAAVASPLSSAAPVVAASPQKTVPNSKGADKGVLGGLGGITGLLGGFKK